MLDLRKRSVDAADLDRMTNALFFEGMRERSKLSRFWVLLILSAVIATLGVMQDSTATVIGAMIVAPLMTPIIGTALAFVLTDKSMLIRSVTLIVGGALFVIAIGFLIGFIDAPWSSAGNSQVSSRVSPALIDLAAALATGLVGAFALVRADVSDTLPGVAIAIALVPPLAVCGLVLQEGNFEEALGAFILFSTNVTAIIFTGTIALLFYHVRDQAQAQGRYVKALSKKSLAVVVGMVVLVAVPLALGSVKVILDTRITVIATPIANSWAQEQDWDITDVSTESGVLTIVALGRPPEVSPDVLRQSLDDAGLADVDLELEVVLGGARSFPGDSE